MKNASQKFADLDIESEEFKKLTTASFELYLAIKDMYRFKSQMSKKWDSLLHVCLASCLRLRDAVRSVSDSKVFSNVHSWFEPLVSRWIDLADRKTMKRIDRAMELDEVNYKETSMSDRHLEYEKS